MTERPTIDEFRKLLASYWCHACDIGNVSARTEFARPGSMQREALGSRGESLERKSMEQEKALLDMFKRALEAK